MDTGFTNLDIVYTFGKTGLAVFLSLPQNIYEYVRHLSIADIGWGEGLELITDKLDEIYLWDLNTSIYMAFKKFYFYKSDIGININDFLVHYKFLYQKFGMTLFDRV